MSVAAEATEAAAAAVLFAPCSCRTLHGSPVPSVAASIDLTVTAIPTTICEVCSVVRIQLNGLAALQPIVRHILKNKNAQQFVGAW